MGLYTLSIYAGVGIMSLIGGYMDQTVGWRWFCWLCAIISGLNVLGFFFFFPETRFERVYTDSDLSVGSENSTMDKDVLEKSPVVEHAEVHSEIELTGVKKSYLQELDPTPRLSKTIDMKSLFVRPYALLAYPAVLWATVACKSFSTNHKLDTLTLILYDRFISYRMGDCCKYHDLIHISGTAVQLFARDTKSH